MTPRPRYARMARMFGRLGGGGHLQVRDIVVSGEGGHRRTGITETARKKDRHSDWKVTVEFEGAEFATVRDAIAAYEAKASGGGA